MSAFIARLRALPLRPDVAWLWQKWTFGCWTDKRNWTFLGIDIGPLEIVWHDPGYRPSAGHEPIASGRVPLRPTLGWKWGKWTFGCWTDPGNRTFFGIDLGPLEVIWRYPGYRQ